MFGPGADPLGRGTRLGESVASWVIEGYGIESELGVQPGLVLLRARQLMQDAQVLLQIWSDADTRVRDGVRQLAGLRHPGLATVLDIGETVDGRLYVALAGLPGPSLATRLREGIDLEQACTLLRRLALVVNHLEQRSPHRPELHAESILFEATGRPVITRLAPPAQDEGARATLSEIGALFYEALTGFAPTASGATLPDYLQRWQPIVDGCSAGGFKSASELLSCLDGLEGRMQGSALTVPKTEPAATSPSAEPATLRGAIVAAPLQEAATSPGAQRTLSASAAAQTALAEAAGAAPPDGTAPSPEPAVKQRPDPPTAWSAKLLGPPALAVAERAPAPAEPLHARPEPQHAERPATVKTRTAPDPEAAALAPPAPADTTRVTAPSRRMPADLGDSRAETVIPSRPRTQLPGSTPEPPPPSVVPLYAASAVAVLVLFAGLWWWLADGTNSMPAPLASVPAAASSAVADARPAMTLQARAPLASGDLTADEMDAALEFPPTGGIELDLAALPTVEDPVARFILFGRANIEAGRLIAPPGRNALERYLLALRIEPSNREAQAGVAEVGRRCLQTAVAAADLDGQLQALECVEQVAAAHAAGEAVLAEAMDLRAREHDRRIVAGAEALRAWRSDEAQALYAEALRLDPQSGAARSGSEESARQGKPGHMFRDRLRDGSDGPELRIVARLGWARNEVSVDEFRRYWVAAGQTKFGQSLPSCRDRESLLRSSRRRSWQAPDFAQDGGHPVVCVNFAMAEAYAGWLSEQTGARYRMPTQAEWQSVAGSPQPGCAANFRDQSAAQAWNAREASECSDGHDHTGSAGGAFETAGLRGLWGNVAEWLSDCDGNSCRQRVAAGGSWFSPANEAGPRGFAAEPGFTTIGIRVVRELPARD